MTKLFTLIFYAMGIYRPTNHPYQIAFVFTFGYGFLLYGLWVEGWLDSRK